MSTHWLVCVPDQGQGWFQIQGLRSVLWTHHVSPRHLCPLPTFPPQLIEHGLGQGCFHTREAASGGRSGLSAGTCLSAVRVLPSLWLCRAGPSGLPSNTTGSEGRKSSFSTEVVLEVVGSWGVLWPGEGKEHSARAHAVRWLERELRAREDTALPEVPEAMGKGRAEYEWRGCPPLEGT